MIPAIVDVEASGFGAGSYPIEVGVVLSNKSIHCFLIKPEDSWVHWDKSAEALHGISREMLIKNGRPIREVADALNRLLVGQTVYSDAWGYDSSWLGKLYDAADMLQGFRLETLRAILSEQQMVVWERVRLEVLDELNLKRHRASADARIIQVTYERSQDA